MNYCRIVMYCRFNSFYNSPRVENLQCLLSVREYLKESVPSRECGIELPWS